MQSCSKNYFGALFNSPLLEMKIFEGREWSKSTGLMELKTSYAHQNEKLLTLILNK